MGEGRAAGLGGRKIGTKRAASGEPAHRVTISTGELYAGDFTVQQTVAFAARNGNAFRSYNQPHSTTSITHARRLTAR